MRDALLIGLAEAAQRLRRPYQDTHRLMLLGELRGEKHGGRWFVRREDVERLAEERSECETAVR